MRTRKKIPTLTMTTMTMIMNRRISLALIALLLLTALPFTAQKKSGATADYALVFVTVYDAAGHSVYGAPVSIRKAYEKKARWEGYSDHQGEFAQRLPVGKQEYIIWVRLKDKAAALKTETKVSIESNERVDISLHLN